MLFNVKKFTDTHGAFLSIAVLDDRFGLIVVNVSHFNGMEATLPLAGKTRTIQPMLEARPFCLTGTQLPARFGL